LWRACIAAASPLVQVAINPATFINPGADQSIDAWVNTGFFLSLPAHLQRFGETYYATRLSWVIPGFALHRMLPPLAANFALHLSLMYALLYVTYQFLAAHSTRHAAMIGTLLVAWSPSILGAVGWDYVDGAGVAWLALLLLCLERAARSRRWPLWAAGAGAAATSLVVTNLTLVILLPACVTFMCLRTADRGWRRISAIVFAAAAGSAAAFGAFALANHALGGQWLFLEPSVRFAKKLHAMRNPWEDQASILGYTNDLWLVVPVLGVVAALAGLVVTAGTSQSERAPYWTLLVAVSTWCAVDFGTSSALLQYSYYTSYLAYLALLALTLFAGRSQPDSSSTRVRLELQLFALLAVAHAVFFWYGVAYWSRAAGELQIVSLRSVHALMFVVGLAGGLIAIAATRLRNSSWRSNGFVLGILVVYLLPNTWGYATLPAFAAERFEATVAAHRFIAAHVAAQPLRFWYRIQPDERPPFRSIASTYLWGYVLVNEELPNLSQTEATTFLPGSRFVLLVDGSDQLGNAQASARRYGFDLSVVSRREFSAGPSAFTVVIADLKAWAGQT
jgi:hypothetical protein